MLRDSSFIQEFVKFAKRQKISIVWMHNSHTPNYFWLTQKHLKEYYSSLFKICY